MLYESTTVARIIANKQPYASAFGEVKRQVASS